MAVNTANLEGYTVLSSLSLNGSGATLKAVDITASTVSGSGTNKFAVVSASTVSGTKHTGQAGTALAPSYAFLSEVSLGLYRSGTSNIAQSYGTFVTPGISIGSELSLGLYRSAASLLALSYGSFTVPGGLTANAFVLAGSSATTAQSLTTAKTTDGGLYFSVLSLTANGAQLGFRSGNTVWIFYSGTSNQQV